MSHFSLFFVTVLALLLTALPSISCFAPSISSRGVSAFSAGVSSTTLRGASSSLLVLIDHGSKNEPSNARLHELAAVVDARCKSGRLPAYSGCIACHMEIASPSLLEVLEEHKPERVFLSPVFISPLGKHVVTDIPAIANDAQEKTGIEVVVGRVVGDSLDYLADGIEKVVEEKGVADRK